MINIKDFLKDYCKKLFTNSTVQIFFVNILYLYCCFVYKTSEIIVFGGEKIDNILLSKKSFIFMTWHGRIGLIGHIIKNDFYKRLNIKDRKISVLLSKHRDGRIASIFTKKIGYDEIAGSSIGKNSSGVDKIKKYGSFSAITSMMRELKNNNGIFLAPDGPKGPAYKMNSKIVEIAKKYNTCVFTIAISYSKKYVLNSWDKFQIPLPFGKVYFEVVDILDTSSISYRDTDEVNAVLTDKLNKVFVNDEKIKNGEIF